MGFLIHFSRPSVDEEQPCVILILEEPLLRSGVAMEMGALVLSFKGQWVYTALKRTWE